jgi:AraC family transcriptional regulator
MDTLNSMNNAMGYIEENLMEDIDYSQVSKIAYCSEYHFKRIGVRYIIIIEQSRKVV